MKRFSYFLIAILAGGVIWLGMDTVKTYAAGESLGYFTGKEYSGNGGQRVLNGGFACGGCTNKDTLVSYLVSLARSGNAQEKTAGAYMINTMIQSKYGNKRDISDEAITELKKRLSNPNVTIEWADYNYPHNSLYNPALNDIHSYDDHNSAELEALIVYEKTSNGKAIRYAVKRLCANPVGGLGLSEYDNSWELLGTSAVRKVGEKSAQSIKVKPGDQIQFDHALENKGKQAVFGISWSAKWNATMKGATADSGSIKANNPLKGGEKRLISQTQPFTIPANAKTGTQYCQRVQDFMINENDKLKQGKAIWACAAVNVDPTAPPPEEEVPPPDSDIWTKYEKDNPIPPGEVGEWTHYLRDISYKLYNGTIWWQWDTPAGMIAGDFFHHIDVRFKQNPNGDFLINNDVSKRTDYLGAPPAGIKYKGEYWPKEEDIGKEICQNFEYDLWVQKYVIKSNTVVVGYDNDDNAIYRTYYYIDKEPIVKVKAGVASENDCTEIGKKPKVQIIGGDARIGGNVQTSLMMPYYRGPLASDQRLFGSWAEYGILLKGSLTQTPKANTATASQLNGGEINSNNNWYRLLFANYSTRGSFSSLKPHDALINQFTPLAQKGGLFSGLESAEGIYDVGSITVSGTVGAGKTVILRGDTITISGSGIHYPATFANVGEISQVVIIANNINIDASVTNIDAWLLARSTINTCSEIAPGEEIHLSQCNNKLTVNGPVATDVLYLHRTFGSEKGSSGEAAEVFNYRADASIWARKFTTGSGKVQTVHTVELPPRF